MAMWVICQSRGTFGYTVNLPCGHRATTEGAKSLAKITKKCMEITHTIADSRYCGLRTFYLVQTNISIVLLSLQWTPWTY